MTKKKSPLEILADSLADVPLSSVDFGTNASNSPSVSDLRRSIELLKETPAMDNRDRNDALRYFQQQYRVLGGLEAPNRPNPRANPYYSGEPTNRGGEMQPPLFIDGQKVTVRTGRTVWTVVRSEVRQGPRGYAHLYYLEDEGGRQTREEEQDLRAHTEATGTQTAKAQVSFDTVVIAQEKREQIEQALEQVNSFDLIFNKWGFGETVEKGRGVSMLFYGPPGTGKTLMAQAIANKLGRTLNIISTADIESSAPGEAERNIRKHFKEAKEKNSILLFDECDSLIFTRSATGPILGAQINELLSQIERFDGVTLFTTNRLGTLDEAVNRRLALKLEIGMPTFEERIKIWERMFPKQAPLAKDVDFGKLAVIEMTGGYIKNAVLRAARMAAIQKLPDNRKKITMDHLKKALRQEAESMIEFEEARKQEDGKRYVAKPGGSVGIQNGQIGITRTTDMEMKESVEVVEGGL